MPKTSQSVLAGSTAVRQLLPTTVDDLDHDALVAAYRYPAGRPWLRANMVASLDGSAVKDGRSAGLGGSADKAVFDVLRGLADVVLVGAGTARAEGYRAMRPKPPYAELRAAEGRRPAPVLALVSRSLGLDPGSEMFGGAERTVVVTHAGADPAARRRLAAVADVVIAGEQTVDLGAALDELTARGLGRVLCEGGPSLLADVASAGRLDELCLTLSPQLVGGDGPRIVNGADLDLRRDLAHLLEDDGVLLGRWTAG
jgi:riboflavin biosynthesis pyrimidine reductase